MPMTKWFAAALIVVAASTGAYGQAYPTKPVNVVTAAPPGGPSDVMARFIAEELTTALGQRFLVENRPGANGALAGDIVAKADPSGYTIMLSSSSMFTITPHVNAGLRWSPLKDFTPIVLIGTTPLAIGVPKDSPYNSLKDLLDAAKKAPGKINFAAQTGSMPHIAGKLLDSTAGIDITHIPFRGGAQMHAAALAGDVNVIIDGITPLIPHFQSGALKPIAVTGDTRVEVLPNTPAVAEVVPGFEAASWFSLFGPANLDPAVVKTISAAIAKMLERPDAKAKLIQMAVLPPSGDANAARKRLQTDYDKFGDVIKRANIKVE